MNPAGPGVACLHGAATIASMARKVWTAAELDQLSPAERQRIFDESLVLDLDDVPPEFVERVRARTAERISTTDTASNA